MSKENKQLNIAFVHNGTDEEIIKSMANDEEHEYSNEELHKAMDKAKLVQKEVSVQGKNGQTFTRKQWVRTGEEVKQPQDTKKQEEVKEKTTSSTNKSGKQQVAEMLTSGKSKTDIMAEFEKQGVTWKKNDHEGINWMRAAMAIQKHLEGSNSSSGESDSVPKAESKPDATPFKESQKKSVIGSDYTQLTTEKESETIEGEAHNMIVGRLKSMGIKRPTKLDVQQAANDLRDKSIKTIISSYNADTVSRNLALANAFGSISNANKLTVERILKDTLERGSGATREQQCDAISKLCGNDSEYEYESFGDNVSVRASDKNGNPIAVTIEPTVKGLFKVEFIYGDGERSKETYDSIDSVKKATESWIKKEEKYTTKSGKESESEDDYMIENPELSDLQEADPYSEIIGENGVTFVKTREGWVSSDYTKKLSNQGMLNMMDNIGGYLDPRGKGNPHTKPKFESKYDINDPSLTNGL